MFEEIRHDPKVKKHEEEINERPLDMRFGTNPNVMAWQRKQREKGKQEEPPVEPPTH